MRGSVGAGMAMSSSEQEAKKLGEKNLKRYGSLRVSQEPKNQERTLRDKGQSLGN